MYSAQGAKMPTGIKHKNNYINVPVLGQYMFANGLRLETGPQVGFLISSEAENGNSSSKLNTYEKLIFHGHSVPVILPVPVLV